MTTGGPTGAGRDVRYTLDPVEIGVRLSLRRRLPDGGLSDVVGVVERHADGVLTVRDRHGQAHDVDEAALVAVKRVPSPPPSPPARR